MKTCMISLTTFLKGGVIRRKTGIATHDFKAEWVEGQGIRINGQVPSEIGITFAATLDNRTCYAYAAGYGFIGGWQYPHRKMPFKYLVEKINEGILYYDQNSLPKTGVKRG